jgi:cytochrome c oxidase subunit 1
MATQAAFMPGTETARAPSVVWSWLTTVDHKRIGILYGTTAFIFFLIGGLEAVIMRLQLARPDNNLVSAQTFNELFTMHGTTMVFLAIMPLSASFFNYMIPLMIGARDVAFPRLNALSYWIFLLGGLFLNASWLFGMAPDGGWFGYANLTSKQFSPTHSIDFWMLGLQILGISSMLAGFNFIVTIINMRAPGMTLMRMPVFIWPAMGIVSEVLPTFARKPLFGAPLVIFSGITIGFLGFGVWSHHMFAVGMGPVADSAFSIATMLIAVPTGVKILNWLSTLWGGALRFKTPLYFSLGFIAMFTMGGLSGVMHASPPVDLQQTDTYFVVAHFHYVLFGGSIFGLFSGIYYWWPKINGKMLDERLGKLHFWLMLIGFNVTFFPQHFLGIIGMPRRIYTYAPDLGWNFWNLVSSIGSLIIVLSLLVFITNVVKTMRSGIAAGPDPWDGRTLEWSIPSPPPVYNFAVEPTVHDRDEFWLEKYGDGHGGKPRPRARAATPQDIAAIHMPSPSYWPLFLAIAIAIMLSGLLISMYQVIVGGLLTLILMYKFAMELHRPAAGPGH